MVTKKATKKATEKQIEPSFSKSQLIKSKRFIDECDLLNALLSDNKTYTIDEVVKLIDDFKKGKVK